MLANDTSFSSPTIDKVHGEMPEGGDKSHDVTGVEKVDVHNAELLHTVCGCRFSYKCQMRPFMKKHQH